jgi:predicted transcriptional regulator
MAATPKGPQKVRIDYNIDKPTYDQFVRICSSKCYAPQIAVERMMKKFVESGGQL